MEVTVIFDIGKTNKKCILFDRELNEIHQEYVKFDEIEDEDDFPCDDLNAISDWIKETLSKIQESEEYKVKKVNFSTYGASLVHLDHSGKPVAPLYNYLKPFPDDLSKEFQEHYGSWEDMSLQTASPSMGMLNSGLQLYWLKRTKPETFNLIDKILHFPQYLSYLFTGQFVTDFTSMGCHTMLWNYQRNNYHDWVVKEGLTERFGAVRQSNDLISKDGIDFGVGVHDSSSSLLPYFEISEEPFLLISTGTWSICLNPFNDEALTKDDLEKDCLNFLGISGAQVRASRLFMGSQFSKQKTSLAEHFQVDRSTYKSIQLQEDFEPRRKNPKDLIFNHDLMSPERFGFSPTESQDLSLFENYEEAYLQLMDEITDIQIASMKLALGKSGVSRIYVDGGFSSNEVYLQFLANKLSEFEIYKSSCPLGAALGAAILVNQAEVTHEMILKNHEVKRVYKN